MLIIGILFGFILGVIAHKSSNEESETLAFLTFLCLLVIGGVYIGKNL